MDKFTNNVASYIMRLSDDEHYENFKIFDMKERLEKLYQLKLMDKQYLNNF